MLLSEIEETYLEEIEEHRLRNPLYVHEENSLWTRCSQAEERVQELEEAIQDFLDCYSSDSDLPGLSDLLEILNKVYLKEER